MVPIHPYYSLLSKDAQSAVNIRLMTGSRMPTGSMLGDYVVQKSRPLWSSEDAPATSSWTSSTSSASSSSDGIDGLGGLAGVLLVFGLLAAAVGTSTSHSARNNDDTPIAAAVNAPVQTGPLSSSRPNGTDAAHPGRVVLPNPGAATKPTVTTTTAPSIAGQFFGYAIVSPPGVNLRPCPGTDCEPVMALRSGSLLTITGTDDRKWLAVDAVDERGAPVHGYVSAHHVTTDQPRSYFGVAPPQAASRAMTPFARGGRTTAKYATVYDYAYLWACAAMGGCWIQATLQPGLTAQIFEIRGDGWTEIRTSGFGQPLQGYVRTEFLSWNSRSG